MKKIKLHFYFWFVSLLFIFLTLYSHNNEDSFIDINLHDTYYLIDYSAIFIVLATIYAFYGLIYWVLRIINFKLLHILTQIHSIITLSIVLIYIVGLEMIGTKPKAEFPLFDDLSNSNTFISIIGIVFIFAQLLFILNIISSLVTFLFKEK